METLIIEILFEIIKINSFPQNTISTLKEDDIKIW